MATHLVKAGYELYVHNRSRPAVEQLAELGAHPCEHAKETAEKSDIVITMLPDSPDVEQVVLGTNGVAEGLRSGGILIDMSSIDPQVTRRIGSHLKTIGVTCWMRR